jgi:CheY-like chemotaxis protein
LKSELALCYYPTNVALIDDNEGFLFNLQQLLKVKIPKLKCATFSNPHVALKFTNDLHDEKPRVFPKPDQLRHIAEEVSVLDNLSQSNGLQRSKSKTDEISVVVVDLDMPGINGLEFCRRIQNPNIKKILLTGMSADQEVIQAFNDNEIHYYLKKSDDNMGAILEAAIRRMQRQYFIDITVDFKSEAIDNFAPLFSDPVFADYFEELCESVGVSEYYFQTKPSRYKLTLQDGNQCYLLVYTDEEIQYQLRSLHAENAPLALIRQIESRTHVPYFATADGFYIPDILHSGRCLYQANLVHGNKDYYCAIAGDINSGNTSCVLPSSPIGLTLH